MSRKIERFIPAPAGNIRPAVWRDRPQPVHPRACGEHTPLRLGRGTLSGSSPRLRGTYMPKLSRKQSCRFIPAPAGNITREERTNVGVAVHPRACGEHLASVTVNSGSSGSSPRLRGTSPRYRRLGQSIRFIPAPAGNIAVLVVHAPPMAVHPRACGEHYRDKRANLACCGSSPRLRGTSAQNTRLRILRRFIPAPAGNIELWGDVCAVNAVHPRACGEHALATMHTSINIGSSPRLRGT